MKKLLILSSVLLVTIIACKVLNKEYCWKCYTNYYDRQYIDYEVIEKRYTDSTTMCGYTELDIQKHENKHTLSPYSITTGNSHIKWQDCYCIKE